MKGSFRDSTSRPRFTTGRAGITPLATPVENLAHEMPAQKPVNGRPAPPPALPEKACVRLHPAESKLCIPAAEETLFAIHAGDGGTHHGYSARSVSESRRPVHVHPERRRHEEGRHDYLCGGMDAPFLRHADHPHRGDFAIAAWERGPRRRRSQRVARTLEYPGRHRHGRHFRQPAGIFESAYAGRRIFSSVDEADYAEAVKPGPWESFNYWGNTPKFAVSLLEGDVRRRGDEENSIGPTDYLPKVDRNFSWAQLWDNMYNGIVKGMFAFGMNGVAIGPGHQEKYRRAEKGGLAGRWGNLSRRNQRVLEVAGNHRRRNETDSDHGLPLAVRGFAEKDGTLRIPRRMAAVEEHVPCLCPEIAGWTKPSWFADFSEGAATVQEGGREIPGSPVES